VPLLLGAALGGKPLVWRRTCVAMAVWVPALVVLSGQWKIEKTASHCCGWGIFPSMFFQVYVTFKISFLTCILMSVEAVALQDGKAGKTRSAFYWHPCRVVVILRRIAKKTVIDVAWVFCVDRQEVNSFINNHFGFPARQANWLLRTVSPAGHDPKPPDPSIFSIHRLLVFSSPLWGS